MGTGKVLLFVGIAGAVGVGVWWYSKKRKKASTTASGTTGTATTAEPGGTASTPGTIAPGEPIPKMQSPGESTVSIVGNPAKEICNVPPEILNDTNFFRRVVRRATWETNIASPYWEEQGRGMDLQTYIQMIKEEGGCGVKS